MALKFQKIPHPLIDDTTDLWSAEAGYFTFVILHDRDDPNSYFCSYRDIRKPMDGTHQTSVSFGPPDHKDQPGKILTRDARHDDDGYKSYSQAETACRHKYKELLARR